MAGRADAGLPEPVCSTPLTGGGTAAPLVGAPAGLGGLIQQKERELHDINEYRLHTLESLIADKERESEAARERLAKLKDDFTYNLRLLEERDAELERWAFPGHFRSACPPLIQPHVPHRTRASPLATGTTRPSLS